MLFPLQKNLVNVLIKPLSWMLHSEYCFQWFRFRSFGTHFTPMETKAVWLGDLVQLIVIYSACVSYILISSQKI